MRKRFFHYTPETKIKEIIQSGQINLATKSVYHKKEKPVAWVFTNLFWENTATKMAVNEYGAVYQLSFDEQLTHFGCARIEVKNNGLMTWAKLKHKANMNLLATRGFEDAGIKKGANPSEWFGSLKPIKSCDWIKIEVYKDGKWVEYQNNPT